VLQLWDGTFHPATLGRIPADALYAPTIVDDNNSYVIARARTVNYLYRLDASGNAAVVASDIGSGPAYGAALMPDNTVIVAEWSGKLHRVTANGAVHSYGRLNANIYQIATDALGTLYATTFNGEVIRMSPDGASSVYATGFAKGKLVAIAVSRAGDVYVAERGDQGRILRINADGTRQIMLQSKGAQFYGLAVDEQFLYAIDMRNRQLLRIPMDAVPARPLVAEAATQPHD
jgi:sugar lactone lactonase YvrE